MSWYELDEMSCDDLERKRGFEGDDCTQNKRRAVHQEVDIEFETGEANGAYTTIELPQLFYSDHGAESATDVESKPTYDTCFGVVIIQTTLDKPRHKLDGLALDVRVSENRVGLYGDNDKLVGLFISDGLASLSRQFSVHMTATLVAEISQAENHAQKVKRSNTQRQKQPSDEGPARIVIYGLSTDKNLIGRHLSTAHLHLQHPTPEEYDPTVEYYNPHLLLRPGAKMPRIQDLSLQDEEETQLRRTGSATLDEVAQGKIWRIFDLASGQEVRPQVISSQRLKSTLQEHQLVALEMMIERECGVVKDAKFPTLWESSVGAKNQQGYMNKVTGRFQKNPERLRGGILADEMGLGKTLSTLALICWYLDATDDGKLESAKSCSTTLVVVPKSILIGWETQIKRHIVDGGVKTITYHGPSRHDRASELAQYDIVLTTYEVLRQDLAARHKTPTLYAHQWCRIVLDEAHRIRSRSSQLYEAAIAISKLSLNRWCLTGTPIHNSLDNYGALLSFLKVPALSEKKMFDRYIANPFKKNQSQAMERLQTLVRATSLRRTIALNGANIGLQPLLEKVVQVDLCDTDAELYRFFQEKSFRIAKRTRDSKERRKKLPRGAGDSNILSLIMFLRLICNYGERLLPQSALEAWNVRDTKAAEEPIMKQLQNSCTRCNASLKRVGDAETLPCGHQICLTCSLVTGEDSGYQEATVDECLTCQRSSAPTPSVWSASTRSAKVQALIDNLRREQNSQDDEVVQKSVIFSCWTKMIDCVQKDLEKEGFSTERIDGQASLERRRKAIHRFKEDSECTVMLASIGSAGEGIDLISACHVHILEPQWNPMSESQAIGRVHRFGQMQRVTVKRYIVNRSIETYIQWIQKEKLRLISQSIEQDSLSQTEVDEVRWKELEDTLSFDLLP